MLGLADQLKRTPPFKIRRAELQLQFSELEKTLASSATAAETWVEAIDREYQQFKDTVSQWQSVQAERLQAGTAVLRNRWQKHEFRARFHELELQLKAQARRLTSLQQEWQAGR